jgi:hypothetical protein
MTLYNWRPNAPCPRARGARDVLLGLAAGLFVLAAGPGQAALAQPAIQPKLTLGPKTGREITFSFRGLTEDLGPPRASLHYSVGNRDCTPMDHQRALGGVRLTQRYRLTAPVQAAGEGRFVVRAWDDALVDEDYFGLGRCRWALESVTFSFASAQGARFVAAIAASDLRAEKALNLRYLISDLATLAGSEPAIFGEAPGFYPDDKPQFTLAVATKVLGGLQ